jgi:IS4 transposase
MRLVIIKKPPGAVTRARAKARRMSRKNQRRTDPRTLAGADYIILLTSLEREEFPIELIGALYRLRWQIELAIKRLKSICISTGCLPNIRTSSAHGSMPTCCSRYC